jgi:hypothetical protein
LSYNVVYVILPRARYYQEKRELLSLLGEENVKSVLEVDEVDIKGYRFPGWYFPRALERGASVQEVHEVMKGYSRVLNCKGNIEVYIYFVGDDYYAFMDGPNYDSVQRYRISYDDEMKFYDFATEDTDSGAKFDWVTDFNCNYGLLEE